MIDERYLKFVEKFSKIPLVKREDYAELAHYVSDIEDDLIDNYDLSHIKVRWEKFGDVNANLRGEFVVLEKTDAGIAVCVFAPPSGSKKRCEKISTVTIGGNQLRIEDNRLFEWVFSERNFPEINRYCDDWIEQHPYSQEVNNGSD